MRDQVGDPRFLETVQSGLAEIRRVLMMDRPEVADDVAAGSDAVTEALQRIEAMDRARENGLAVVDPEGDVDPDE